MEVVGSACVCCVLSVVCCVVFAVKTPETGTKMDKTTGQEHDENSVGKYKNARSIGNIVKTRTPF